MLKFLKTLTAICVLTFVGAQTSYAADIEIEMLNKLGNERMVFSKKFVKINKGDTIKWKATDKLHNVVFIKGGVPEGVELFKSKMSKDIEYTFTVPGIYAYKCQPHYGMGMIGFVQVGDNKDNLEAVQKIRFPGKAKKVAQAILADI